MTGTVCESSTSAATVRSSTSRTSEFCAAAPEGAGGTWFFFTSPERSTAPARAGPSLGSLTAYLLGTNQTVGETENPYGVLRSHRGHVPEYLQLGLNIESFSGLRQRRQRSHGDAGIDRCSRLHWLHQFSLDDGAHDDRSRVRGGKGHHFALTRNGLPRHLDCVTKGFLAQGFGLRTRLSVERVVREGEFPGVGTAGTVAEHIG